MKKRTRTWLLVLLVLLVLGGGYAYREFNRKAASIVDEPPVVNTGTTKILEDFSKDLQSANAQYLGKVPLIRRLRGCKEVCVFVKISPS